MYWIFADELEDEDHDADLSGSTNVELGGELSLDNGETISQIVPGIVLTLGPDARTGRMTDHLSVMGATGPVFSGRLREQLHNLGVDNVQYFDLEIRNPGDGSVYTDYKLANIVGHVDCVNTEQSELKFFDNGDIKRIRKLVLDEEKIPPELKIFRLSNRRTLTVVHESIRNAFNSAGITGCVFYEPEDYR